MISKKNNKGFSLVEVIVSMLVLSIVISSVLTAFSVSAKANLKTKKTQSAESLMEDLLELAGAVKDSSKYADTVASLFGGSKGTPTWEDSNTVEKCIVSGISKGSFSYDVEITRDTEPDGYSGMNSKKVLSFGESDKVSVLVNASNKGNLFLPTDSENGYDKMAVDYFVTMRNTKIAEDNLSLSEGETPTPEITPGDEIQEAPIREKIDRDVYLEVIQTYSGKMQLVGYFSYEFADVSLMPSGTSTVLEYEFFRSVEYNSPDDTTEGAVKLNRIYVLYSPFSGEITSTTGNYDVRIWDPNQLLDAEVYLVYQDTAIATIDSDLIQKDLETRFRGGARSLEVSFGKKGEAPTAPKRVDLYGAGEITYTSVGNVTATNNQMISESQEIRVQEITIKITDSEGKVMASDGIACLQ